MFTKKSSKQPDYEEYSMNVSEFAMAAAVPAVTIVAVALLCYGNVFYALLLSPYILLYMMKKSRELKEKHKWELNVQFGDAINALSAVLESGYSIENAVTEAYNDLKLSYSEQDPIMIELKTIIMMLRSNIPIEEAFLQFADRSGLEDVKSFADVFATAKRTGGNIIEIIRRSASVIRTRVELKRELKTMIASKKYESDIMRLIPFAVMLYLRVFSPEMITPLYGSMLGTVFMTVILLIYVALGLVSDKLMRIVF